MRIQRIYIDTSVLDGYFDKEFEISTHKLLEEVSKGENVVVTSNITE